MSLQPEAIAFNTNTSGSSYFFSPALVLTTPYTSHINVTYGGANTGAIGTLIVPKSGRYFVNMTYSIGLSTGTVTAGNMSVFILANENTIQLASSSLNTNTIVVDGTGTDSYYGSAIYPITLMAGAYTLSAVGRLFNSGDTNTYDLNMGPVYLQYLDN